MKCWLEADDAAQRSRDANRATGVGADCGGTKSRSNGCRRATARAAGNARGVPRIAGRAVMGIVRGHAVGKFVEIRFAENNRAGGFETCGDLRVFFRNKFLQKFCSCGCTNPHGIDVVFERNGNPMERAVIAPGFASSRGAELGFRSSGLGKGEIPRDGEISVEFGVELLDAREKMFRQFNRRKFAGAKEATELGNAKKSDVGFGHEEKNLTQRAQRSRRKQFAS